jgi:uncharacterized protein (PEP-CTERM system associated)
MIDRAMSMDESDPSHPGRIGSRGLGQRALGLAAVLLLVRTGGAAAFPFLDSTSDSSVPQGTELTAPDAQDLRNQLQLANGLGAPPGGGWTVVPRIDWQEMLTDNALEVRSPRQADVATFMSPGISITGDMPRVQLSFDFAPTLALYARTTELNSLTQQMNGIGTVTLVPDLAFVDVRAVAGVTSQYGGLGGLGTLGAPSSAATTAQATTPSLAGNAQGLNRNNEVQTTSFGLSPYLLRRFGDWGTGKLGDSLNVTRSNALSGFFSSPIPTGGGVNDQTLVSNEENAHFVTGDFMAFVQNSFDLDLIQSQTTTDANGATIVNGVPIAAGVYSSRRTTVTDQLNYALSQSLTVFVSGGHEDISYSNQHGQSPGVAPIDDLTWSFGGTWSPNADSALTVSYGHANGFNSLTVDGHYAPTARTVLSVSYGSTLGSQLEYVQSQLNQAGTGGSGTLVNPLTGGSLFGASNALAAQDGIFRTTTLTLAGQTTLDRDIVSIDWLLARQTSASGNTSSNAESKTASVSWLHQMRPDMTVSAAVSYAIQDQSVAVSFANPGNNTSIVASLAWQWQISDTLTGSVRYSFFERQSQAAVYDLYQNMLILGISKRF